MVLTMRLLIVGYALLCLIALWFVPASAYGWLGIERDPLAGVFALLLALPWSLLRLRMGDPGPWLAPAVLAAGMAMNSWLVWRLQRRLQGRQARGRRS